MRVDICCWQFRLAIVAAAVSSSALGIVPIGYGAGIGITWQSDADGYGLYSVADEAPASAFGVLAAHWFEPSDQIGAGSLSVLGGQVDFSWSSSSWDDNPAGLPPQTAYGWARANQGPHASPPGDPATGEAVVLSKFLFATGAGEYGTNAHPIVLNISGLDSIANLSAGYTVTLIASSQYVVDGYTPGEVSDNDGNAETISFVLLAETPPWDAALAQPYYSSGAVGASAISGFTGDTLSIVLDGFNEIGDTNTGTYTRTTLSGVTIEFTPVPEPTTIVLMLVGVAGFATALRSRFVQQRTR